MEEINNYKELRETLVKRQNILSMLTKKWTENELKEYNNILTECEIKKQILFSNESLFDDIELSMLKRCVR